MDAEASCQHVDRVALLVCLDELFDQVSFQFRGAMGQLELVFDPVRCLGPRHIGEEAKDWPTHWLTAEGLDTDALRPRGATTTIADLLARAATGVEATGTIRVHVGRKTFPGDGGRWEVSDDTGRLDLWCPAAVMAFPSGRYDGYEVDAFVHPPQPDIPEADTGWDLTATRRLARAPWTPPARWPPRERR